MILLITLSSLIVSFPQIVLQDFLMIYLSNGTERDKKFFFIATNLVRYFFFYFFVIYCDTMLHRETLCRYICDLIFERRGRFCSFITSRGITGLKIMFCDMISKWNKNHFPLLPVHRMIIEEIIIISNI